MRRRLAAVWIQSCMNLLDLLYLFAVISGMGCFSFNISHAFLWLASIQFIFGLPTRRLDPRLGLPVLELKVACLAGCLSVSRSVWR